MGATCPQDWDVAPGHASLASLLPSSPAQAEGCVLETPGALYPGRSRPRPASFPQGPHLFATAAGMLSKGSVGSSPTLLARHQWCKVWWGRFSGAGWLSRALESQPLERTFLGWCPLGTEVLARVSPPKVEGYPESRLTRLP